MYFEKAITKTEKYLDVKVQRSERRCLFSYGDRVGSFLIDLDGEVHNFHNRRKDDHTNSQMDYFAGYYLKNLTQLLHSLKAPPLKFPIGTLIRGKENKRGVRMGTAGKVALVVGQGKYGAMEVIYAGNEHVETTSYERDFEEVKQ